MTPSDVARWNIALMQNRILSPESFKKLTTEVHLSDGEGTKYALGFDIGTYQGMPEISHDGSTIGGGCGNRAVPKVQASMTECTNIGNNGTRQLDDTLNGLMSHVIAPFLVESTDEEVEKVRKVLDGLRTGGVAGDLFTARGRSYFNAAVLKDYRQSLRTLGELLLLTPLDREHRGGMTRHVYRAEFETAPVTIVAFVTSNGTFEQFMIFRN